MLEYAECFIYIHTGPSRAERAESAFVSSLAGLKRLRGPLETEKCRFLVARTYTTHVSLSPSFSLDTSRLSICTPPHIQVKTKSAPIDRADPRKVTAYLTLIATVFRPRLQRAPGSPIVSRYRSVDDVTSTFFESGERSVSWRLSKIGFGAKHDVENV